MSIRNKRVISPVKKYIEYRASASKHGPGGVFYYYDKETKKNIDIPYPITLVDVDSFGTITGYNKAKEAKIYSNERKDQFTPFVVRYSKKGTMCTGLYKDIKEMIKANGGVYATVIYAILNKEVVKFTLKGSAMSAWLERPQGDLVTITGTKEESNGAAVYQVPIFEAKDLSQEDIDKISTDYAHLYDYLDNRSEMTIDEGEQSEMVQIATEEDPLMQEPERFAFQDMTEDELELKVDLFKQEQEDESAKLLSKVPF